MKPHVLHSHTWDGEGAFDAPALPRIATSALPQPGHLGPLSFIASPFCTLSLAGATASVHKHPPVRCNPCYLMRQKPCASIPSGTLNLLRKFSSATAAVSSTTWASS